MTHVDRKTLLRTGLATTTVKDNISPRSWVCRILATEGPGQEIALGRRKVRIGADRRCDIILEDPRVSRYHAELHATPQGVRIRDLGSTNGTFWQGSRIGEIVVPSGSTVRFGATDLHFTAAEVPTVAPSSRTRFGGLVGSSIHMREMYAILELVSATDVTVVLEGESGTGKELAARAIHDHSDRARTPLVVLDCSAISESLIDSHLFGHVKGAFTGAHSDRKGAFLEANGGTLFLDEIGELSPESQTKLLRALEAQTVQPVGSDRSIAVDTRVVAASHRSLARLVEQKKFRFDLFYRLAVVHIQIPSLRDRLEDLPQLVQFFYEGRGTAAGPIEGPNLARLRNHGWPGNIRELRNVLERAWALSGEQNCAFQDLQLWVSPLTHDVGGATAGPIDTTLSFKEAKARWVDGFERRYLAAVFTTHGQNITHAAEHAGINRRHFRTLLRKHGIIDG